MAGRRATLVAILGVILVACGGEALPTQSGRASPDPFQVAPSPVAVTPSPMPTPVATVAPTPRPSPYPAAALPVHGKLDKYGAFMLLAPAPNGSLYVLVPHKHGAVLARLDRSGAPAPGWPVALPNTTQCSFLAAAADGSVRAICDATDTATLELPWGNGRAFALDADGRPRPGWPVDAENFTLARVIGDDLVILSDVSDSDTYDTSRAHLSRIGPDGSIETGVEVPLIHPDGWMNWAIGPDGVAYATYSEAKPGELLALDLEGPVSGWPMTLPVSGSAISFEADASRIILVVGVLGGRRNTTHILAIDPADPSATPASGPIPVEFYLGVDCGGSWPGPMSRGGVTVVQEGLIFHAFDADLRSLPGWPYHSSSWFQEWVYPPIPDEEGGLDCGRYADPVLGPDGTLFLPLDADSGSKGGSLVAVGSNGKIVPGWPVGLRRAGSGFWSVEVADDGTVFAAAVERESKGLSSTILGIAPDSTVLWRTTVLEP